MSELFVVGISWRTAPVAVREQLAFRDEELVGTLQAMTAGLPVAEALLVSTCNRVEVYGVSKPGTDPTGPVRAFLASQRGLEPAVVADVLYDHRGSAAVRHVFSVASALDSLVLGEAQILGQLKTAYGVAGEAGTSGPLRRPRRRRARARGCERDAYEAMPWGRTITLLGFAWRLLRSWHDPRMSTYLCGSGVPEGACCGPILGGVPAATALALMRSRYVAYVRGAVDYLIETHDPTTRATVDRAAIAAWSRDTAWLGLEIVATERGGPDDDAGIVEFIARGATRGVPFAQRERSRFRRVAGRWSYVDGHAVQAPSAGLRSPQKRPR